MRVVAILLTFLAASVAAAAPAWRVPTQQLGGVRAFDLHVDGSRIIATTDKGRFEREVGEKWKMTAGPSKATKFGSSAAVHGEHVCLTDTGGKLECSHDRGHSYERLSVLTNGKLTAVATSPAGTFFAAGPKGTFATSADHGNTWRLGSLGTGFHPLFSPMAAAALSEDEWIVVGQKNVAVTRDRGVSWKRISLPSPDYVNSIAQNERGHVFLAGRNRIYRSTDGARSFKLVHDTGPFFAVAARGDSVLVAGYKGLVLVSQDGGVTFHQEATGHSDAHFTHAAIGTDGLYVLASKQLVLERQGPSTGFKSAPSSVAPPRPIASSSSAIPPPAVADATATSSAPVAELPLPLPRAPKWQAELAAAAVQPLPREPESFLLRGKLKETVEVLSAIDVKADDESPLRGKCAADLAFAKGRYGPPVWRGTIRCGGEKADVSQVEFRRTKGLAGLPLATRPDDPRLSIGVIPIGAVVAGRIVGKEGEGTRECTTKKQHVVDEKGFSSLASDCGALAEGFKMVSYGERPYAGIRDRTPFRITATTPPSAHLVGKVCATPDTGKLRPDGKLEPMLIFCDDGYEYLFGPDRRFTRRAAGAPLERARQFQTPGGNTVIELEVLNLPAGAPLAAGDSVRVKVDGDWRGCTVADYAVPVLGPYVYGGFSCPAASGGLAAADLEESFYEMETAAR